jgi:hypothetical protein
LINQELSLCKELPVAQAAQQQLSVQAHGGKPEQLEHVCTDMSGAFLKEAKQAIHALQRTHLKAARA